MTTIAIKDGVMAVDSAVTDGSAHMGTTQKWIRAFYLGQENGFMAFAGQLNEGWRLLGALQDGGHSEAQHETVVLWIKADGSLHRWEHCGPWVEINGDFHAEGTGRDIALGAMAAGATAEEAVRIACELDTGSAPPVHVLSACGDP